MRSHSELVDRHLSARLRLGRVLKGMTQAQLAEGVGVLPQQIHKYETGASRMTGGRLHALATILKLPVRFFYEGLENEQVALRSAIYGIKDVEPDSEAEVPHIPVWIDDTVEVHAMVEKFARLSDPVARRQIILLLDALTDREAAAARSSSTRSSESKIEAAQQRA